MTLVIYKYPMKFSMDAECIIEMPQGARSLSVGLQYAEGIREYPHLWALIDRDKPSVRTHFLMIGTGWNIQDYLEPLHFIGTLQFSNRLVFHFFQLLKP